MLIDHLIYADPSLETAVADMERRFGVRAAGGGQHLGQGTHNVMLSLGPDMYLELIAPDPLQPEPPRPRPYGAAGVRQGGLVGWALACDDIEDAARAARREGFDLGSVIEGSRRKADGDILRWRLTENALAAGVVPFLISWGETPHPAASAPHGLHLDSFHVEHPDPGRLRRLLEVLDVDVEVRRAERTALVARLTGPRGSDELR